VGGSSLVARRAEGKESEQRSRRKKALQQELEDMGKVRLQHEEKLFLEKRPADCKKNRQRESGKKLPKGDSGRRAALRDREIVERKSYQMRNGHRVNKNGEKGGRSFRRKRIGNKVREGLCL